MKYDSQVAYISSFANKIRTVSGRDEAEREVADDILKFERLQQHIRKSVGDRDSEVSRIQSSVKAITLDRSSYVIRFIVHVLKPKAAASIRNYEAEIARLSSRRARLFGKLLPIDKCLTHLDQLMLAARTVLSRINENRRFHAYMLEQKKQERSAKKAAREASLDPYRKRIELGEAALGRTRLVASSRKKALARDHPCPYCGGSLGKRPVADHIYPVARGGLSTPDNMIYCCNSCNQKKRDFLLTEFIHKYGLDMTEVHIRLMKQNKRF